jgi:hypothetical protein
MQCRCPACRRTTSVTPEQVDFLVRCDRCKTFFLARSIAGAQQAERAGKSQPDSAFFEVLPPLQLADLLSRDDVDESFVEELVSQANCLPGTSEDAEFEIDAVARAHAVVIFRRKQLRRFELRWRRHALGVIGVCGLLTVLCLALCLIVLKATASPRPARASTEMRPVAIATQPAYEKKSRRPTPALPAESPPIPSSAETSGDLFPNIPPAR